MISRHDQLDDAHFLEALRTGQLPSELFTHEAHLRLGWIHLNHRSVDEACLSVANDIRAYVQHIGAADKYHETITHAAVRTVHHFRMKEHVSSFGELIAAYPQLLTDFKSLLGQHYSWNIFTSETARSEYIDPDLLPFD